MGKLKWTCIVVEGEGTGGIARALEAMAKALGGSQQTGGRDGKTKDAPPAAAAPAAPRAAEQALDQDRGAAGVPGRHEPDSEAHGSGAKGADGAAVSHDYGGRYRGLKTLRKVVTKIDEEEETRTGVSGFNEIFMTCKAIKAVPGECPVLDMIEDGMLEQRVRSACDALGIG
jgi:hypothetical protein